MKKKFSLFDFFRIPDEFKDEIDKKNRIVLTVLLRITFIFGSVCLFFMLFSHAEYKHHALIYYASYIVLSFIGFILLKVKAPVPLIQEIVLFFIVYVFTFMMGRTSIVTTIITFLAFLFLYIMVMETNPLLFVFSMTIYLSAVSILITKGITTIPVDTTVTFVGNMIMVAVLNFYLAFWKRRHVINELTQDKILSDEQEKTEFLLHNVFPQKVINQLKIDGKAPPEKYENITVLFADIVDFTKTVSSLDPKIVIDELNEIFTEFDKITEKNSCMRIKTVGDAYLAVCGLPDKNEKHAEQLILCAREYISYLEERNKTEQIKWNIRIGIDSGNAIAGIIGLKKYVYDILGSTVDTAVKIEQACKPMRIAVSDHTFDLIKDVLTSKEKESIDLVD